MIEQYQVLQCPTGIFQRGKDTSGHGRAPVSSGDDTVIQMWSAITIHDIHRYDLFFHGIWKKGEPRIWKEGNPFAIGDQGDNAQTANIMMVNNGMRPSLGHATFQKGM